MYIDVYIYICIYIERDLYIYIYIYVYIYDVLITSAYSCDPAIAAQMRTRPYVYQVVFCSGTCGLVAMTSA
jgi:hypothetical protein